VVGTLAVAVFLYAYLHLPVVVRFDQVLEVFQLGLNLWEEGGAVCQGLSNIVVHKEQRCEDIT